MKQLNEKVAIVTGAGQGIGKGIALCLAKRGVKVVCTGRRLEPIEATVEEINDIKTAVSEAVTNCIVHGYKKGEGKVKLYAKTDGNSIHINVFDKGIGIENLPKALEPFYTTKPEEERSGMGFTIMKSFMDEVLVTSKLGVGTEVYMKKTFNNCNKENNA